MINYHQIWGVLEKTSQNFFTYIWQFETASSRLYFPFLLPSLIVIFVWAVKNEISIKHGLLNLLKNRSFHIDVALFCFNGLLKTTVFASILLLSSDIAWQVKIFCMNYLSGFRSILGDSFIGLLIFSLFAFLFDDYLRFFVHCLMHRIPFLWKLHRVHHTATSLNPLSLFRAHPIEVLIATFRNALSGGIIAGLGVFLFGGLEMIYTVLGVNVFGFVFNACLSNLRHSPVPIRFGLLERVFISPYMHQIHHSSDELHFNKNFGTCFSIWDKLNGSLVTPKKTRKLKFGC